MSGERYTLRIQEDAFRRAEELAAILKIECTTAFGLLGYLWRWVLTLKQNGPPDGIVMGKAKCIRLEAAARWRGDRGRFIEALEELGLIVRQGNKIRVKGTKPYADEYRAKERKRESERERRRLKKSLPSVAEKKSLRAVEQVVDLYMNEGVDAAGEYVPDHPLGAWSFMMRERAQAEYVGNGIDTPRSRVRNGVRPDRTPCRDFFEWHKRMKAEKVDDATIATAWLRYLGDKNFESRGWPLALFIQEAIFRHRLTQSA